MNTYPYLLPDVGEGLGEGEIVAWRVAPGDEVSRDQIIAEIQTDKSVVEIPSPVDGVLRRHGAAEGEVVPVGELLAEIDTDDALAGAGPAAGDSEPPATADGAAGGPEASASEARPSRDGPGKAGRAPISGDGRVRASPSTRKYALAHGVDLASVEGSGPGGRVTLEDVKRAEAAATETAPEERPAPASTAPAVAAESSAEDEVVAVRGLRRQIARSMTASASIPTIYDWRDVDATELLRTHEALRANAREDEPRLTLLSLVVKAVTTALRQHRRFNATYDPDREEIIRHGSCNVGLATATPEGLIVPVLAEADRRSIGEIGTEIERLAAAARDRSIEVAETRSGTVTVSNYGSFGARYGNPIIRAPEVAIVGVGRVYDGVVAVDGQPAVRPLLPLAVGTDHRVNDGDHLAAFCATLEAYLVDPRLLLSRVR